MDEQELTMKPSEILDKAADILDRDGWMQGAYFKEPPLLPLGTPEAEMRAESVKANREAPCCQAGAICRAATGYAWARNLGAAIGGLALVAQADDYMSRYVLREFGWPSTIVWNDREGRSKLEVQAALRGAAADARADGN